MRLVSNGPRLSEGLALTGVARAWHLARPAEPLEVVVPHPVLWEGNPDATSVVAFEGRRDWGVRSFPDFDAAGLRGAGEHLIRVMCRRLAIEPPVTRAVRPYFYPTEAERDPPPGLPVRYVTISHASGQWTTNRDWPFHRWAHLVRALRLAGAYTVQIGAPSEGVLACDADWRGCSLRTVAQVLAHSAAHVALVSGTMALSAAVGGKCVVIWSGREDPVVMGYPGHHLIGYRPPMGCAPCWLTEPCPHGRVVEFERRKPCLDGIEVSEVLAAVLAMANVQKTPWEPLPA